MKVFIFFNVSITNNDRLTAVSVTRNDRLAGFRTRSSYA